VYVVALVNVVCCGAVVFSSISRRGQLGRMRVFPRPLAWFWAVGAAWRCEKVVTWGVWGARGAVGGCAVPVVHHSFRVG